MARKTSKKPAKKPAKKAKKARRKRKPKAPPVTLLEGDCVEQMQQLEEASVHAVITDPPYGLEFMGKEWDSFNWEAGGGFSKPGIGKRDTDWPSFSATSRHGTANRTCGACGGRERGKKKCACDEPEWKPIGKRRKPENEGLDDTTTGGGMLGHMRAFQGWTEQWAREAYRVLKPGGWLLAFGGTRTYHRLACAVEDAGFEVRDCISWVYGQGFPKSLDAGRADPAWQGWGTALKPAQEPIVLARKPFAGTVASNLERHSTGALHIDAGRVAAAGGSPAEKRRATSRKTGKVPTQPSVDKPDQIVSRTTPERYMEVRAGEALGRWPANLALSHAEGCERVGTKRVKGITGSAAGRAMGKETDVYGAGWRGGHQRAGEQIGFADADGLEEVEDWRCVDDCPVAVLDRQTGESQSGVAVQRNGGGQQIFGGIDPGRSAGGMERPDAGYGDFGGASRFFYCTKAPQAERWFTCRDCDVVGRKTADAEPDADCPVHGSNPATADFGPLFGGTERPKCACPSNARDAHAGHDVELHPTQKPVELMRWLVRLVAPPGGVVLDPFNGSGTTGAACSAEGVRYVGIERHAPYLRLTRARLGL